MKFIPFICCGDPGIEFSCELIRVLAPFSHLIELGIPFSDPVADGKTIQIASGRAINNGINTGKIFSMAKKLRKEKISVPFAFMAYFNSVHAFGCEKFLKKMKQTGIQGIIIPDLPFGEDLNFESLAKKHGISVINLIAPNTGKARAKKILNNSNLFTYLVSTAGTTGARKKISKESIEFVKRTRKLAGKEKKLFVGFGVSNALQARQFMQAGADGVIIGSELINIYSRHLKNGVIEKKALIELKDFAEKITQA